MITRNNDDGSVTFIYESWDELVKSEPKWQPDADLAAKDRADERIWGYSMNQILVSLMLFAIMYFVVKLLNK